MEYGEDSQLLDDNALRQRAEFRQRIAADPSLQWRLDAMEIAEIKAKDFLQRPEDPPGPTRDFDHRLLKESAFSSDAEAAPARVQIVAGSTPRFGDDDRRVLRSRLQTTSLTTFSLFCVALLPTLTFPGLALRVAVIVMTIGCHLLLRSSRNLTLRELRVIELFVIGLVSIQGVYMPNTLMLERARVGDFATVIMDREFIVGMWAMLIMAYALFIPNTWRRASVICVTLSLIPIVDFHILAWYDPHIRAAFQSLHHGVPLPLTIMAAAVSIYCSHAVRLLRRQAFENRRFGQYRLKQKLGAGGMGEVYAAEHELLKRPCAIKLIRQDADADAKTLARFEAEVHAAAALSHWNTIEIYDYGRTDEGALYYVMELLPGLTLEGLVEEAGPLPPGRIVFLLRQVCDGLAEAHSKGLIHRDLKPLNIFAAQRGGAYDVAKVLDFGLVGHVAAIRESEPGLLYGTPCYMSPEQATASRDLDERSDIYSLGAVAYHLAAGRPPFQCDSPGDYVLAHVESPPTPPSFHSPGLPADLELVILRCLAKKPEERYASVLDLRDALDGCRCAHDWTSRTAASWWKSREFDANVQSPASLAQPQPAS